MRIRSTWCLAVLCTAVLINAGHAQRPDEKSDKGLTLLDKDSGKKVQLAKGDSLTLQLEMTAGTGFTWVIAKNNAEQLAPKGKPTVLPPRKGVVGGTTAQVFQFKAEAPGVSELELHYKRPFEKDKEPAKTFKVTVEIK